MSTTSIIFPLTRTIITRTKQHHPLHIIILFTNNVSRFRKNVKSSTRYSRRPWDIVLTLINGYSRNFFEVWLLVVEMQGERGKRHLSFLMGRVGRGVVWRLGVATEGFPEVRVSCGAPRFTRANPHPWSLSNVDTTEDSYQFWLYILCFLAIALTNEI